VKIPKYTFVGNLILSTRCEFYFDDVTVTLFINTRYVSVAAKSIPYEQRSVICFRWEKGRSANASQSEMRPLSSVW